MQLGILGKSGLISYLEMLHKDETWPLSPPYSPVSELCRCLKAKGFKQITETWQFFNVSLGSRKPIKQKQCKNRAVSNGLRQSVLSAKAAAEQS